MNFKNNIITISWFFLIIHFKISYAYEVRSNDQYILDDSLFKGQSSETIKILKKISNNDYNSGFYNVDIYVNGEYLNRKEVYFKAMSDDKIQPCFSMELINSMRIRSVLLKEIKKKKEKCIFLTDYINSDINFNLNKLSINILIPQNHLINLPLGYINPDVWNDGDRIAFLNYMTNYYHSSIKHNDITRNQNSGFISINGGMNFGKWQYRQYSNLSYRNKNEVNWQNTRSIITRPIEQIKGNLLFGQTYTSGRFFSGLRFIGFNLSSDDRMLPQSMRGYAPTIKGVANTHAKVSIYQNKQKIYETSVAAGGFTINDLSPTSLNGDLFVQIEEANGNISEFTVPFSAVPQSLRPKAFKYNIDVGKTNNIGEDSFFTDGSFQYGLNNKTTLISGLRFADGYYAGLLGTTYTDYFGALGSTMTYSYAENLNKNALLGWMLSLNYSKNFTTTQTTISLAAYKYSTENYRDLNHVLEQRSMNKKNVTDNNPRHDRQSSRFDLTMNQSFGRFGTLFLSGSITQYHHKRDENIQLQLGYSQLFYNRINLNISLIRQYFNLNYDLNQDKNFFNTKNKKPETSVSISLNIPLSFNRKSTNHNLATSYLNNSQKIQSYQTTFSGFFGDHNPFNYYMGVNYEDQSHRTIFNGGLGKKFTAVNTHINTSISNHYQQLSGNIQGAFAIHSGGITFGHYLSDTFALIEAKGAYGAEVNNLSGIKIDHKGYALVPSLTPYQFNTISLNPVGTSYLLEVEASKDKIVPYAGATLKVKFNTKIGYPVLIQSRFQSGEFIPFGATVRDEKNEILGIVGQNGQMYIRTNQVQGILTVVWGDSAQEKCHVNYRIPNQLEEQPIIRLTEICAGVQ